MCGIAGIWNRDGRPVLRDDLVRMNSMQAHRGPDGSGLVIDGAFGLAHTRLKIVDLSDLGNQPMRASTGDLTISFNGEIHNYLELREELEKEGFQFRTATDTEVILCAFQKWGYNCFERFNGMWAMALWSSSEQRLVLCRDRFGIKPLCYSVRGARLAFASEPKAILSVFPEEREMDGDEVHSFLLGGNPDSGDSTFFKNIKHVPSATHVTFTLTGNGKSQVYWGFEPGDETGSPRRTEEFRELLTDAVAIRLRSDVPIGACLSGGLDSSSVTRLAASAMTDPIHCFSLRYEDYPKVDESRFSAAVADDAARYHLHWVRPSPRRMVEIMRLIVWHHDAPVPIRGRFAKWWISDLARRYVTVTLVGEGGDELLGGYSRFAFPYTLDRLRDDRSSLIRSLNSWRNAWRLWVGIDGNARESVRAILRPLVKRWSLRVLTDHRMIARGFARSCREPDPNCFFSTWLNPKVARPFRSFLNNALWQEFRCSGLPELLHSEDAISMAFSLESRPPFLDHRLVEFCFSQPYHTKISGGWTKSVLRKSMKGILPEEVRFRRDKKGMPTPHSEYMKEEANLAKFRELLLEGVAVQKGIFDRRVIERSLSPGSLRRRPMVLAIVHWRFICVELWMQLFLASGALVYPEPRFENSEDWR